VLDELAAAAQRAIEVDGPVSSRLRSELAARGDWDRDWDAETPVLEDPRPTDSATRHESLLSTVRGMPSEGVAIPKPFDRALLKLQLSFVQRVFLPHHKPRLNVSASVERALCAALAVVTAEGARARAPPPTSATIDFGLHGGRLRSALKSYIGLFEVSAELRQGCRVLAVTDAIHAVLMLLLEVADDEIALLSLKCLLKLKCSVAMIEGGARAKWGAGLRERKEQLLQIAQPKLLRDAMVRASLLSSWCSFSFVVSLFICCFLFFVYSFCLCSHLSSRAGAPLARPRGGARRRRRAGVGGGGGVERKADSAVAPRGGARRRGGHSRRVARRDDPRGDAHHAGVHVSLHRHRLGAQRARDQGAARHGAWLPLDDAQRRADAPDARHRRARDAAGALFISFVCFYSFVCKSILLFAYSFVCLATRQFRVVASVAAAGALPSAAIADVADARARLRAVRAVLDAGSSSKESPLAFDAKHMAWLSFAVQLTQQLGETIVGRVHWLAVPTIAMLKHALRSRCGAGGGASTRLSKMRRAAFGALLALMKQYPTLDRGGGGGGAPRGALGWGGLFEAADLWDDLQPLLRDLPRDMARAEKPSVLLRLIELISREPQLCPLLSGHEVEGTVDPLLAALRCLSDKDVATHAAAGAGGSSERSAGVLQVRCSFLLLASILLFAHSFVASRGRPAVRVPRRGEHYGARRGGGRRRGEARGEPRARRAHHPRAH
jgi:hypothetical protein